MSGKQREIRNKQNKYFNTPHGLIGRTLRLLTHKPYIHMTIAGHREYWVNGPLMEKFNLWYFGHGAAITISGSQAQQYLNKEGDPQRHDIHHPQPS